MSDVLELYEYCKKNIHTKSWIADIKGAAWICLKDQIWHCNGLYYYSKLIQFDYVVSLWSVLKNQRCEEVYFDDVVLVVNRIFKNIAEQLMNEFYLHCTYRIVLQVRESNTEEAVLWLGPAVCSKKFAQIFQERGYEAAMASL